MSWIRVIKTQFPGDLNLAEFVIVVKLLAEHGGKAIVLHDRCVRGGVSHKSEVCGK